MPRRPSGRSRARHRPSASTGSGRKKSTSDDAITSYGARGRPRVGGVALGDVHLSEVCGVLGEVTDHAGREVERVHPAGGPDRLREWQRHRAPARADVERGLAGPHLEPVHEATRDDPEERDAALVVDLGEPVEHGGVRRDALVLHGRHRPVTGRGAVHARLSTHCTPVAAPYAGNRVRATSITHRSRFQGADTWHPSKQSAPARSSTRAATPPSRSRCCSTTARSAAPPCRAARRRASSRRSSCATAATATSARACRRPSTR